MAATLKMGHVAWRLSAAFPLVVFRTDFTLMIECDGPPSQ